MEDNLPYFVDQKEEFRKVIADQYVITNMLANVPVILPITKVIPDDKKRKKMKVENPQKTGINRKKTFICGVCQQEFLNQDQILDHVSDYHTAEVSLKLEGTGTLKFQIKIGDKYPHLIDHNYSRFAAEKVKSKQDVTTKMLANVPGILPIIKAIPDDNKSKKKKVEDPPKRRMNSKKSVICASCQQEFLNEDQFLDHVNKCRTNAYPFPCDKCKKRFAEANQLKTHQSTHDLTRCSGEPQCQCKFCNKQYQLKVSLANHCNLQHLGYQPPSKIGKSPFRIFPRNKGAIKPCKTSGIEDHGFVPVFNDVTSQKPQVLRPCHCSICDITLPGQIEFQEHLSSTHADYRRLPCPICKKRFANMDQLRRHKRIHNLNRFQGDPQLKCDLCDKSYHLKESLYSHYQFVHLGKKNLHLPPSRPTTQPIICHHSIGVRNPNPKVKPIAKLHQCPGCDLKFSYRYEMRKHMRRHANDRPYKCDKCGQTFVSNNSLATHHKRVHDNIFRLRRLHPSFMYKITSSWDCDQCERKFKTACQLKSHKRLHTGEKPYKCEHCSSSFRTSWNLKLHKVVHIQDVSPLKAYKCLICGMEGFKRFSTFNQHRKSKHLLVPYQKDKEKAFGCVVCGKPFFLREDAIICALLCHNPETLREKMFKIKCPVCPEDRLGYCSQYFLRKHWRAEHPQIQIPGKYRVGIEKDNLLSNNDNLPSVTLDAKKADQIKRSGVPKDQKFDSSLYMEFDLLKVDSNLENPKFVCEVCKKSFQAKRYLKCHISIVHSDGSENKSLKRVITKSAPMECTICNQKFAHGSYLKRHLKRPSHRTNVEKKKNEDSKAIVKTENDKLKNVKGVGTFNEVLPVISNVSSLSSLIKEEDEITTFQDQLIPNFKEGSAVMIKQEDRENEINTSHAPDTTNMMVETTTRWTNFNDQFVSYIDKVDEDRTISLSLPMEIYNQLGNLVEESSQASQNVIIKQEIAGDGVIPAHISPNNDGSTLLEDTLMEIGDIQVKVENWEQNNEGSFQIDVVKRRGRGRPRKNYHQNVSNYNSNHGHQDNILEEDNLVEIGDIQVKVENWDEYNKGTPKQIHTSQTSELPKRGRGRPRKIPQNLISKNNLEGIQKKARGRPRKIVDLANPESISNIESKRFMCDFKTPSENILRRHLMAKHIDNNGNPMPSLGIECNATARCFEVDQSIRNFNAEESTQKEAMSISEAVVGPTLNHSGDEPVIWNDKEQLRKLLGNREMRLVLVRVDDDDFDLNELMPLSKIC